MSKFINTVLVTLVTSVALWTSGGAAHAGQKTQCTVYDVEFYAFNAGSAFPLMIIHCVNDSTTYRTYYNTSSDACPIQASLDQVKIWTNMATSAYIAGKTLTINWTSENCLRSGNPFTATNIDSILMSP